MKKCERIFLLTLERAFNKLRKGFDKKCSFPQSDLSPKILIPIKSAARIKL